MQPMRKLSSRRDLAGLPLSLIEAHIAALVQSYDMGGRQICDSEANFAAKVNSSMAAPPARENLKIL